MASRIPVVATASEGATEIIEENDTGRLVPIGDHTALAAAILELLNDDDARDRLSRNAFEAVKDRFSLGRMIDSTEALYREVLLERTANR
jgi:glycosyltransferase involved in cell wall biosynthesis